MRFPGDSIEKGRETLEGKKMQRSGRGRNSGGHFMGAQKGQGKGASIMAQRNKGAGNASEERENPLREYFPGGEAGRAS